MKNYSNRQNCVRAARVALGSTAKVGEDFTIEQTEAGFNWASVKKEEAGRAVVQTHATLDDLPREKEVAAPVAVAAKTGSDQGQAKSTGKRSGLQTLVELLKRPEGASLVEIADATGWLQHTARARISVDTKKLGLTVSRVRDADRGSVYRAA